MPNTRCDGIRDWVIYRIINPSGRVYIGKTLNFAARLRCYRHDGTTIKQPLVYRSFKKYGMDTHKFDIIDTFTSTNSFCNGKELFWIKTYMSNINKYPEQKGMNLTDGGDGTLGFKKSPEEVAKMVLRNTGRKQSDAQKQKTSERHKGNKYNLGRVASEETKMKMSIKSKARNWNPSKEEGYINPNVKGVVVLDNNGAYVTEYQSISLAAKSIGVNDNTLRRWLHGKAKWLNKKNRNFIYKFK